ncbi:MAG: thioredoxin family protein [Candidatus Aenigmatarchaeota archaeon]
MKIEILGFGCEKCKKLEENVKKALKELGKTAEIDKVTDYKKISEKVMFTPALVINGKVASEGKILSVEEIKKFLK